MKRFAKSSRVVGVVAGVSSIPFAYLAGLAVPVGLVGFLLFVALSIVLVSIMAMLLFSVFLVGTGRTRVGFCVAGALTAVAVSFGYVAIFALTKAFLTESSWRSVFDLYSGASLVMFSPVLLVVGMLAGLVASSRRFAT